MSVKNIQVQVKLMSKKQGVQVLDSGVFLVRCRAVPEKGQANKEIIKLLSKHLKIPKTQIKLILGSKSKTKVFSIE